MDMQIETRNIEGKRCTKCGTFKPMYEFDTNGHTVKGTIRFHSWCKSCLRKRNIEWSRTHKEYFREWNKANPDKVHKSREKWLNDHPERRKEVRRNSYRRHIEHNLEYSRHYRLTNQEKVRAYNANYYPNYYTSHKEELIAYQRIYRATPIGRIVQRITKLKRRTAKYGVGNGEVDDLLKQIKQMPYVVCYLCGNRVSGEEAHIDHIIPLSRGGSHTKDNIAPTHRVCNQRKGAKLLQELDLDVVLNNSNRLGYAGEGGGN